MEIKTGLNLLENNKIDIEVAINSSINPSNLLNRYIIRNPEIFYNQYIKYYNIMNENSKVVLFKHTNIQSIILAESQHCKSLQQSLLNTYFVDENALTKLYTKIETHTIENILMNFDITVLSLFFSQKFEKCLENTIEYDDFLLLCIQKMIKYRGTDFGACFSNAINKRLTCNNMTYYQKGVHLINIFTTPTLDHISELKNDTLSITEKLNFELETCENLYAELPEKYQHFRPRAIETCIEKIVKNKNPILTKVCLIYLYNLIPSTTIRSLKRNSRRMFQIILNFNDDKIEQLNYVKIKLLSQLIKYDYENLMKFSVELFYGLPMVKKHILVAIYSECIRFLEFYDISLLLKLLLFNYKVITDEGVRNELIMFLMRVQNKHGLNSYIISLCVRFMEKIVN